MGGNGDPNRLVDTTILTGTWRVVARWNHSQFRSDLVEQTDMVRSVERRKGWATAATAILGCFLFGVGCRLQEPSIAPRIVQEETPTLETGDARIAEILEFHNRLRASRRLPPLADGSRLASAAIRHARDMAQRGRMSHRGGDGSNPFRRIEASGYQYTQAAENVAFGQTSVESVMNGWMRSPPHRRNILGPYTHMGASFAEDLQGRIYWCVTFGTPATGNLAKP